jgi:peptidoglycan hydrolase-like protein with peptidoglycan-binding domain
MRPFKRTTSAAATALLATTLAACNGAPSSSVASHRAVTSTTSTTVATTTTEAPTSTTAKPLPGIGVGAKGPEVQALEQKLAALHYDPGRTDGTFDSTTSGAVMAFQKVTGMARTGRATDDVVAALRTAVDPTPMVPGGGSTRVEVDLKRQVLFLFQDGALTRILPVSTGSGQRYCVDGECDVANTPGGSYRVGTKILGDHVSKLGHLYNPLFFNGGIAIHGSPSVPAYPASHGCVRIPMADSLWFYNTVRQGTAVYVVGGKVAPVPFNEAAPGEANSTSTTTSTAAAPVTTSTTAAPATTTTTSTSSTTTTSTTVKPVG